MMRMSIRLSQAADGTIRLLIAEEGRMTAVRCQQQEALAHLAALCADRGHAHVRIVGSPDIARLPDGRWACTGIPLVL